MESSESAFLIEEIEVIKKYFSQYDSGQGSLRFEQFHQGFKELIGGKKENAQRMFTDLSENNEEKLMTVASILNVLSKERSSPSIQEFYSKVSNIVQQAQDAPGEHRFKFYSGQLEQAKTKFEVKISIDKDEVKQHFDKISEGLKLAQDQISIVIKFHTNKPSEAKDKIEKLVKSALAILKNTVIKPNTPESILINSLKFEYVSQDDSVTLAVRSEHKGIKFLLDYFAALYNKFELSKLKTSLHLKVNLKNDFTATIDQDKGNRNIIKIIKEGAIVEIYGKTNSDKAIRNAFRPTYDLNPPLLFLLSFLQRGSNVLIGLDDLDLESFSPINNYNSEPLHLMNLDILEKQYFVESILNGISSARQTKMPIIENGFDLLENYLNADIEININLPYAYLICNLKTNGIKDLYKKLQEV